jgi:hypothetical protein
MADRKSVTAELRLALKAPLLALGFEGKFPYYRKRIGTVRAFLMVMFDKYGGAFYIEVGFLSQTEAKNLIRAWTQAGATLVEDQLTCAHCRTRVRLVAPSGGDWFKFSRADTGSGDVTVAKQVADQAAEAVKNQLEELIGVHA